MNRIKLVLGGIQIEYEGSQEFIENELVDLAERIISLAERAPITQTSDSNSNPQTATIQSDFSTNTIAQIISVKTGSDLALAAIARINLVKQQSSAPRQTILDEMREATTYFKETYASNLSSYLDTLVKSKRVNLVARATYALAANERTRLQQALANGD